MASEEGNIGNCDMSYMEDSMCQDPLECASLEYYSDNNDLNKWEDEEIRILIELWGKNIVKLLASGRHTEIFNDIAIELQERFTRENPRTMREIGFKISNLRRQYRYNLKRIHVGKGQPTWRFFRQIHGFLSKCKRQNRQNRIDKGCQTYSQVHNKSSLNKESIFSECIENNNGDDGSSNVSENVYIKTENEEEYEESTEETSNKRRKLNEVHERMERKLEERIDEWENKLENKLKHFEAVMTQRNILWKQTIDNDLKQWEDEMEKKRVDWESRMENKMIDWELKQQDKKKKWCHIIGLMKDIVNVEYSSDTS